MVNGRFVTGRFVTGRLVNGRYVTGRFVGVCYKVLSKMSRAQIFKLLRSPKIDSKEPIPPGCVAWRAGTTTLFLLGSYPLLIV